MANTAEIAGVSWRRLNARGIGDGRVFVTSGSSIHPSLLQAEPQKIVIHWNSVLQKAVERVGGSEPVYIPSESNGLLQSRVRFRVPLNSEQTAFEEVEAIGMPCIEAWEAESTAARFALGEFERGPFRSHIFDVSHFRCDEMEKGTYRDLLKAGEVLRSVKLLLSDWEDTMMNVESCYKELYEQVLDNTKRGIDITHTEILSDSANRLYNLNRDRYLQFGKLCRELEEIKGTEHDIRTRADRHFHGRSHDRPELEEGHFPKKIKLCMQIILDEMIRSLDWDDPAFKHSTLDNNLHLCEVLLLPKRNGAETGRRTIIIGEGKGQSPEEALENSCRHALLLLDTQMSIRLLDVNYSLRSHAEIYISEAKEVKKRSVTIGTKVIAEWEVLTDGLQACKEHYWKMAEDHPGKEPWNQLYNAKCECAGTLTDLYQECMSDLVLAKDRHVCLSTWTDQ